jgi:hypothetical protein
MQMVSAEDRISSSPDPVIEIYSLCGMSEVLGDSDINLTCINITASWEALGII